MYPTVRSRPLAVHLVLMCAVVAPSSAVASRLPPAEVPPVVDGNVRYEAPPGGFGNPDNPCGQVGGCVVVYDNTTGALLWSVKVYCISYDPNLEEDVQWVFISSLALKNGQLLVSNERGSHFAINPATQQVSGDSLGCNPTSSGGTGSPPGSDGYISSGCSVSPWGFTTTRLFAALVMLGAAALVVARGRWSR